MLQIIIDKEMTSKSKAQLLLRNDRRGEQRHQLSTVGDIRDNTISNRSRSQLKLPRPCSTTNIDLDTNSGKLPTSINMSVMATGTQQQKVANMSQNRFIASGSASQREQLHSSLSDVGVDDRNDNTRSSSAKGNTVWTICLNIYI